MADQVDVAIVGGGIAGLVTAYRLMTHRPSLRIGLFESSARLGGKILTEHVERPSGRFVVEAGPDAFLAQKPWAKELLDEIGLSDQIVPINTIVNPVAVLKNGRPIDLPDGISLIAPTKIGPFLRSPLLGWGEKLRACLEPALPRRNDDADESLGNFVRRRLGVGALDWIAEPLAAGVYNADPDSLSLDATFPQFRKLEREHGSVIHALRAVANERKIQPSSPTFLTLKSGMQDLVDALAIRIGHMAVTSAPVTSIDRAETGEFRLSISNRLSVSAEAVVLALPAHHATSLLSEIAPDTSRLLRELRTVPTGTLSMAFRESDITRPLSGYGMVIPRREREPFNALTISSRKFDGRAPAGWQLLRLFFGGTRSPETMTLDDDRLIALAFDRLRSFLGITAKPELVRIHRWSTGSPQYDVGHLHRIKAIENSLPQGLSVVGSSYTGVGIPDIVRSASEAVEQMISTRALVATV